MSLTFSCHRRVTCSSRGDWVDRAGDFMAAAVPAGDMVDWLAAEGELEALGGLCYWIQTSYWKYNIPVSPSVCRSVGWSVGQTVVRSVCHNFLKGQEVALPSERLLHEPCVDFWMRCN